MKHIIKTVNPTANDGIIQGYTIGTLWINTETNVIFQLADVTAGNAIWNISSGISDILYSELLLLVNNNRLSPGAYYKITDYRTILFFRDTDVLQMGDIEPLIVFSTSPNSLCDIAYSQSHPHDTIYYDINNNVAYGASLANSRPGYIYRRIDNNFRIDLPEDWRNVKVRRYAISNSMLYQQNATYNKGDVVIYEAYPGQISVYYCCANGETLLPTDNNSSWFAFCFYQTTNKNIFPKFNYYSTIPIQLDLSSYTDYNIFNHYDPPSDITIVRNGFGSDILDTGDNVFFGLCSDCKLDVAFINTFDGGIVTSSIGTVHNAYVGNISGSTIKRIFGSIITGGGNGEISDSKIEHITSCISRYIISCDINSIESSQLYKINEIKGFCKIINSFSLTENFSNNFFTSSLTARILSRSFNIFNTVSYAQLTLDVAKTIDADSFSNNTLYGNSIYIGLGQNGTFKNNIVRGDVTYGSDLTINAQFENNKFNAANGIFNYMFKDNAFDILSSNTIGGNFIGNVFRDIRGSFFSAACLYNVFHKPIAYCNFNSQVQNNVFYPAINDVTFGELNKNIFKSIINDTTYSNPILALLYDKDIFMSDALALKISYISSSGTLTVVNL